MHGRNQATSKKRQTDPDTYGNEDGRPEPDCWAIFHCGALTGAEKLALSPM
jgi:hypothetical protein